MSSAVLVVWHAVPCRATTRSNGMLDSDFRERLHSAFPNTTKTLTNGNTLSLTTVKQPGKTATQPCAVGVKRSRGLHVYVQRLPWVSVPELCEVFAR